MENIDQETVKDFIDACRLAGRLGLVRCSSGNLSYRYADNHALITASRSWLQDLTEDQVAVCSISSGEILEGGPASVESRFHLGILRERTDVDCVFHFQSPAATTIACMPGRYDNLNVIPEIPYYIGAIARVPYILPGSEELSDAVIEAMRNHNLAILQNHGLVTVGKSARAAIQNAAFFELACDVMLRGQDRVQPLADEAVRALTNHKFSSS